MTQIPPDFDKGLDCKRPGNILVESELESDHIYLIVYYEQVQKTH